MMRNNRLMVASGLVLLFARLWSALRVLPWGPAKAAVWIAAALMVGLYLLRAIRTARRVAQAGGPVSEVYGLWLLGAVMVTLALSVHDYLPR